jgi:hypothetical protein
MSYNSLLLIFILSISFNPNIYSQCHYNSWLRSTFNYKLNQKLQLDNEFQYRRQNGLDSKNAFERNLLSSYRLWFHLKNENQTWSFSPFAYLVSYPVIFNSNNEFENSNQEFRFSVAHLKNFKTGSEFFYWNIKNTIEYRIFSELNYVRFRNRLGSSFKFNHKCNLIFYEELFFNGIGNTKIPLFDQFRGVIQLEVNVLTSLKLDLGYMFSYRQNSKLSPWKENNFILNLTYNLN